MLARLGIDPYGPHEIEVMRMVKAMKKADDRALRGCVGDHISLAAWTAAGVARNSSTKVIKFEGSRASQGDDRTSLVRT